MTNYLEAITAMAIAEASRPRTLHEKMLAEASRPLTLIEKIIAEHVRPRTLLEKTIADFAKEPTRISQLNAMARDYVDKKRRADTFASLVQTRPIRQALEAEIVLPTLAD